MSNITVLDSTSTTRTLGAQLDANGNLVMESVPLVGGNPIAAGNPMPVNPRAQGVYSDRSGTVATGGQSQQLAAANSNRKIYFVTNLSLTEMLYINFTASASTTASGSVPIAPGGTYVDPPGFVTTEQINVTAPTAGHPFLAKEG